MEAEEAGGDGPPKAFTIIKDACSQTKAWFIAVCTPPPLEVSVSAHPLASCCTPSDSSVLGKAFGSAHASSVQAF